MAKKNLAKLLLECDMCGLRFNCCVHEVISVDFITLVDQFVKLLHHPNTNGIKNVKTKIVSFSNIYLLNISEVGNIIFRYQNCKLLIKRNALLPKDKLKMSLDIL